MVIPWNGDAMSIPWKFHGNFIWAKTHGKLMDFSFEIFMGYFYKEYVTGVRYRDEILHSA